MSEPRFTTEICLSVPVSDAGLWRTLEPLNFWSEKFQRHYVVPKEFETDLASVPRLPIVFWLVGGRAPASAVLHDWLYGYGIKFRQITSRVEADEIFYEAMLATAVPPWAASAMYRGVRLLGSPHFESFETRSFE